MELFQHIQQVYSFLSGAHQKNLGVCKYENDALWDTVAAVTGEMTRATTSPSSSEIIASQKDGCNLRDSALSSPVTKPRAEHFLQLGVWKLDVTSEGRLKNLMCQSRAISQ